VKRVVLVRPAGPRNVGSVVRLAANFGPCEVVLVRPERPSMLVHPDFEQMAHGVPDLDTRVRVVERLEDALSDCTASVGFTARARDHRDLLDWREAREPLARHVARSGERVALVFGNEETGLTAEEVFPLGQLVKIPVSEEHGSLNLAMAVSIVVSTLFLAAVPDDELPARNATPVSGAQRTFLIERMKDVFAPLPWTEPARRVLLASIERVFGRAPLETRDARAWHLLLRAMGNEKAPVDYGIEMAAEPDEDGPTG
jgi:TrmH family RNA methyltransferase